MKTLSVAQMQMVEIAKAISTDARLIIMDEPTSAITEREVEHLHRMIRSLRESGVAIIYITHKMDEVFKIADKVTVFRDGKHVATLPAAELDRQKLITLMVGRELTHLFPKEHAEIGEVVMSVRGLTRHGVIDDITLRPPPRRDPRPRGPHGRRPDRGPRGDLRRHEDRRRRDHGQRQDRDASSRPRTPSRPGWACSPRTAS